MLLDPVYKSLARAMTVRKEVLYFSAAILSLLFSLWVVQIDHVINNDGVIYLRAARLFAEGDWQAAIDTFKWPFYSILVALTSKLTFLEMETSAKLLNGLFITGACLVFLRLVEAFGGNRSSIVFAAIVILLYYGINRYRAFVIRDPGFLLFYLSSILILIEAHKRQSLTLLGASLSCALVAGLFRIEGVLLIFGVPLYYAYQRIKNGRHRFFWVSLVTLSLVVTALTFTWWLVSVELSLESESAVGDMSTSLLSALKDHVQLIGSKVATLNETLLGSRHLLTSHLIFLATIVVITFTVIAAKLDLIHAYFVYGVFRKKALPTEGYAIKLWSFLIAANIGMLLLFVSARLFLAHRYAVPCTITLLIVVPFYLERLYQESTQPQTEGRKSKRKLLLALSLILAVGINGLSKSTDKSGLREAGKWLSSRLDNNSSIFTNSRIVAHYSGLDYRKILIDETWRSASLRLSQQDDRQYTFTALVFNNNPEALQYVSDTMQRQPLAAFNCENGDTIQIYGRRSD